MIRAVGAVAGVATAGLAWGLTEASCYALRQVEAPLLPPGQAPIRVLHISDIHLAPWQRRKSAFVRSLQELEPDLVVNTGDNISFDSSIDPVVEAMGGLLDVPGVFVFGSNDYKRAQFKSPLRYLGVSALPIGDQEGPSNLDWRRLRDLFLARGWHDLTNQRAELTVAGRHLAFRGTDDAHMDRDRYDEVAGPAVDADLNIGVTHAPYLRLLDAMARDGMDLVMAGHTHGGQVCLPGRALVTNCDIEPARVKGYHSHTAGGRTCALHVSAGIGTSPYAPYRVFCRPEATLLTLVSGPGRDRA
ncbi:metallophosphoesterase [Aestuariimicrobium ganziense]|uniref:metallophosphoesterase n=1 Tax=Aestuariimicrobium ganziense TaxID=2773677 RepID=UPI001942C4A9|nr:metallophosphoesterase [Aestuariimicrobium ganziense]